MDSLLNTYLTMLKMSENDPRYESMLFNYETTMKDDFRNGAILNQKRTTYKEKETCLRPRYPPLKDIHTLTDWKTPHLPIDLFVKPKEVVRTDPRQIQKPYKSIEDVEKEEVRAKRPRLVMTPAISMDDIVDKKQQALLLKDMYTSSAKTAMELGIASLHEKKNNVKSPLRGTFSPANPLALGKLQFRYVSPEWRMQSASWDSRQLRAHCDPDKDFYLSRPLRCKICKETAVRELERKMLREKERKKQNKTQMHKHNFDFN